jgi:two-component system, HptB-dependent secretion and biofilm response regulator
MILTNDENHACTKILIADDSNTDRMLLDSILRKQGHEVVVATNGREAIEVFLREKPSIILLDALMPEMDGFEAAQKIKKLAGEDFVPIIFLTSLQEADSLAHCLDAGGDDFLSKPYNRVILQAKINALVRMRDMHHTVQQQRDQIVEHNHRLLREQEIAKRVFDKVAHAGCLDIDNIQYRLSPIAIFNGDVALAGVSTAGSLVVLLGDFTGHGLDAAIGAMPLAQAFYSMLAKGFALRDILREVNCKLHEILPVGVFSCALVADIDFTARTVKVWNGGLPDCVIYRPSASDDKKITPLKSRHLPFGILPSKEFVDAVEVYEVEPGDCLYMWSDGIHEAQNPQGEMFGERHLWDVFQTNSDPGGLFDELNHSVNAFIKGGTLDDDISLVEVKIVKSEEFNPQQLAVLSNESAGPKDWTLNYQLRPDTLREFDPLPLLLHVLMQVSNLRPHSTEIYTVMAELYSNALEHGVLKLDSAMKNSPSGFSEYYTQRSERLAELQDALVTLEIHYCGNSKGGVLSITVEDSGEGFAYQCLPQKMSGNEQYSGRGIRLLKSICESIEYFEPGNRVCAVFVWGEAKKET